MKQKIEHILVRCDKTAIVIYKKLQCGWGVHYERNIKTNSWNNVLGSGLLFDTKKGLEEYYVAESKKKVEYTTEPIIFNEYLKENYEEFM
jgi:hypothetical protein